MWLPLWMMNDLALSVVSLAVLALAFVTSSAWYRPEPGSSKTMIFLPRFAHRQTWQNDNTASVKTAAAATKGIVLTL